MFCSFGYLVHITIKPLKLTTISASAKMLTEIHQYITYLDITRYFTIHAFIPSFKSSWEPISLLLASITMSRTSVENSCALNNASFCLP